VSRRLLFAIALVLVLPARAVAQDVTIVSRDVPLAGQRSLASGGAPARFNLVGLHWRGPGSVQFRTRSLAGRWSAWQDAAPEAEDQPDGGTAERARLSSWRLGNPWWVGPSNRIEYRTHGRVTRLRAFFVWSPAVSVPARTLQKAGAPSIVPRRGWNADETIRRSAPSFAPALRLAIVHHTAGRNGYSAAESPAIVRAIQLYHVRGNGWNDIGYNFLVDRFGTVFEGRYGGTERNVVGAHAEGFNTGSVGVAVVGEYSSLSVSTPARDAVTRLLAWRLDLAHVEPASTLSFVSGGNARFPAGVPVFLRTVSGHRDTGLTDCPGRALYDLLTPLAGRVAEIGLPKLYTPTVAGAVPGTVRFRARLSALLPWTVDVSDASGSVVASGSGYGAEIDWRWDASLLPPGSYSYAIRAGADVTPALGTIGGGGSEAPLAVTGVATDPETVSPNADGVADQATLTYTLTAPANVAITVRDAAGATVATLPKSWRRAAEHAVRLDAAPWPDGVYTVEIAATATGGRQTVATTTIAVSRTLGAVVATRKAFSPNLDGRADRITFTFRLAAPAEIRLRILKDGKWVATPYQGPLAPGARKVEWDGTKRVGRLLDGDYEAVLEATDAVATSRVALPFSSDTRRPDIRIVQRYPLRVWVSEPARLTLRFGARTRVWEARALGTARVPNVPKLGLVRVVAWDSAGNSSIPKSKR
jgi:N-acetylmuramoyl-L-alanine amidase